MWEEVFGNSGSQEEFLGFEPQEMSGNSDEDFVVDGNADNAKGETRDENNEISVDWSSKLDKIHVEKFIEMYGLTNDLGTNAMAKDFPSFYRLFIP